MAIEGPISELNLIDLFQILSFNQKTGILYIENDDSQKSSVYFDKGNVVFVYLEGHNIGLALIKSGIINKEEYEKLLQQLGSDEVKIVKKLIENKYINEQQFRQFLRTRIEDIIFSLFEWNNGYFKFEEGVFSLDPLFKFKIKTESLIMEGSRRIDEWSRLSSKIPSTDLKPILSDNMERMDVLSLEPKEWEILSMINGENSIKDIADKYGNEFEIAKLIYGMITLGIVKVNERTEGQKQQDYFARAKHYFADGLYDKVVNEIKMYLKNNDKDINAYVLICNAYYALHQFDRMNNYAESAFNKGMDNDALRKLNAIAYYKRGMINKAIEEFNKFAKLTDSNDMKKQSEEIIELLHNVNKKINELIGGIGE